LSYQLLLIFNITIYIIWNLSAHDSWRILDIKNNIIKHSVTTEEDSSGSSLIKRYNNNFIIGLWLSKKMENQIINVYIMQ